MRTPAIITIIFLFLLVVAGGIFFATRAQRQSPDTNKLHITTSFYPLYFFTSFIAGDKAQVTNITPAGAEPHDYEPTAQDLAAIERSKLLVLHSTTFEAWANDVQKNLNPAHTRVLLASEGLASGDDPHTWLNIHVAKKMVERITNALIDTDTANGEYYQANADLLVSRLDALDALFHEGLENCQEHMFVTSHAAFGYLADEYHLTQKSIAGLSPEAEPSAQDLATLTDVVRENDVHYIFFETLASPKLAEALARETNTQTLVLNPIEGLTPQEIANGKDYFTVMRENLANLQTALDCAK